jgi:L-threonylcarbamoyladenylate synthase
LTEVARAVAAIEEGELVVIPTDTVYGLACTPEDAAVVRALSQLKRRAAGQPIALVAASVDGLIERAPELRGRAELLARSLLPGPLTLVLPNPARRYPWLTGERPQTIGVRVPEVEGPAREFLAEVAVVAATSANRHGGTDPRRLADVPREILDAVVATVDGGELPGTPSTVLDLTAPKPRVLREGAVPAADVLARVAALLAE